MSIHTHHSRWKVQQVLQAESLVQSIWLANVPGKTTNKCLPYKAYVHFLSKPSLTRCEATLRKHDKIWRESYICRSLISQSNVSLLKNVTENRKRNSFHETFYKKRMWNWQSRCPGQSTDSVNFYLCFVLLLSCK